MAITAPSAQALSTAWNTRRPEAVAAVYAPRGARQVMGYGPGRVEGHEALIAHVTEIMTAVPDFELVTRSESVSAEGVVTFEWTFRGTQQADFGPIPASGQEVVLEGVSIITMDGRLIGEERVYWDGAVLMAAAGMLG